MAENKLDEKNLICEDFQEQASEFLLRHKSILDIMSKMQDYNSRINRAVFKSVTSCGCISINASKQDFTGESYGDLAEKLDSHIQGKLCPSCKEVIDNEIGSYLFYLASLCNSLDLSLMEIIAKEYNKNNTLGIYSLR